MSISSLYWWPMAISVICDIILSYKAGAKTIGELFSIMSVLSFIPLMNMFIAFAGALTLLIELITSISSIEIPRISNIRIRRKP